MSKLHQWLMAKRGLGINLSVDTIYTVWGRYSMSDIFCLSSTVEIIVFYSYHKYGVISIKPRLLHIIRIYIYIAFFWYPICVWYIYTHVFVGWCIKRWENKVIRPVLIVYINVILPFFNNNNILLLLTPHHLWVIR